MIRTLSLTAGYYVKREGMPAVGQESNHGEKICTGRQAMEVSLGSLFMIYVSRETFHKPAAHTSLDLWRIQTSLPPKIGEVGPSACTRILSER
jgi:hypothetical protein